jgi:hypothetical protein
MANKFASRDYKVCGLEGLWWVSPGQKFLDAPRASWQWKLMIRTPEFITPEDLKQTIEKLRQKGKPAANGGVRNGLTRNGHHHEIYLSDPRRVKPEKLRTILRQPVT